MTTGLAIRCMECNVWKAGYGHLCDNPLVRDDCLVCMKTETTIFMGYYKNTPRCKYKQLCIYELSARLKEIVEWCSV